MARSIEPRVGAASVAATALTTVVVLAALTACVLAVVGLRPSVVRSDSMAPTLRTGDVLVQRSQPATAMSVGDVVTFADPHVAGRTRTHRVRAITAHRDRIDVETRGDANGTSDHWSIDTGGRVGTLSAHLPSGRWMAALALIPPWVPAAIALACAALALALGPSQLTTRQPTA